MNRVAFLLTLAVASTAQAAPRLLALDDVYDCGFAADGRLLAATGGGLRIGARVVTALDGLPDTLVEKMRVVGDDVWVETRAGSAKVSLSTGKVSDVVAGAQPPRLPARFDRFGEGIVRASARAGLRRCLATSDGLFVAEGAQPPARVSSVSLPTGDVAALVARPRGLFVGTFDRGLYVADASHATRIDAPAVGPNINALAYDGARAVLWVATARGLARCDASAADPSAMRCRAVGDRLAVHALLLDAHGGVVAGGDERVLFVSADGRVDGACTRKDGARFRSVWSLARGPDGTLYAGTTSGIFFGRDATFTRAPERLSRASMLDGTLPDDWVTALLADGDRLVAGTYNAGVVTLRAEDASTLRLTDADASVGYVNPSGLTRLPDGTLAVATMDGLRIGQLGGFRTVPTLGRDVTAVAVDARGPWIASRRGVEQLTSP
jgi:ligand-binding sensor domain-containing protein